MSRGRPSSLDAAGNDPSRRNARRNLAALIAVMAVAGGAAVAMAATVDDDGDGAPGSSASTDLSSVPESSASPEDSGVVSSLAPSGAVPSDPSASSRPDDSTPDSSTGSSSSSTSLTTTTVDPASVAHAFPVDPAVDSSYTPQSHANYQATDIFAGPGCGTALVAPVTGTVDEVLSNVWDPAVGDPATRGGNAVSILGDDGVRYYLAHFQTLLPEVVVGARMKAGDPLGEMGDTGRAGACHVHFGLSLPCENDEWWVRRGVVWPDEYLDSWRDGGNLSPLPELQAWFAEYPDACASIEGTPYPVG